MQLTTSTPSPPESEQGKVAVYMYSTPGSDTTPPKRPSYFTAVRKVMEWKELQMGALCEVSGVGAALRAMADSEINPILAEGEQCGNHGCCCSLLLIPCLRVIHLAHLGEHFWHVLQCLQQPKTHILISRHAIVR